MKAFLFLAVLMSQVALADTFSYQLYYDNDQTEALDIRVDVKLTGQFNKKSKVVAVKIWGIEKKRTILLFDIPGNEIKAKWKANNTLELGTKMTVNPLIKKEYIAIHSDTNINPGEEYDFENLVINKNGTLESDEEGFFLANQTVEEMALNGYLKAL
ncbi:MAG: hypothetical protein WC635_11945 [Bacteriovorax sp.]